MLYSVVSYFDRKINEWVQSKVNYHVDPLGKCQETKISMVGACHEVRQPLQNHSGGHLGGSAMPWSAEEMLGRQRQRADIPARARTAHRAFCRKDWKHVSAELSLMSPRRPDWSRN